MLGPPPWPDKEHLFTFGNSIPRQDKLPLWQPSNFSANYPGQRAGLRSGSAASANTGMGAMPRGAGGLSGQEGRNMR